ncbi:hypothetical protein Tco_1083240 [Tanacetum coccineum]
MVVVSVWWFRWGWRGDDDDNDGGGGGVGCGGEEGSGVAMVTAMVVASDGDLLAPQTVRDCKDLQWQK